ncbi:hypothetical protein ACA040_001601 [Xenophilus aerolatus]
MIRIGTLCYVVESCTASPATERAVGRIVEVCSAPYEAPNPWQYLPGTYYDVLFEGWTFYCHADKLRPISDPDAASYFKRCERVAASASLRTLPWSDAASVATDPLPPR